MTSRSPLSTYAEELFKQHSRPRKDARSGTRRVAQVRADWELQKDCPRDPVRLFVA
jgi:hypothetical protein